MFTGDANDEAYNANNKLHHILQNRLTSTLEATSAFLAAVVKFPFAAAASTLLSAWVCATPPSEGISPPSSSPLLPPPPSKTSASQPSLWVSTPAASSSQTGISREVIPCITSKTEAACTLVRVHTHRTAYEKCMHTRILQYCTLCFVRLTV